MGFRDKIKGMKQDLLKTTQDSIDHREDSTEYGSIFIKENIPEGVQFWRPDYGDHLFDMIPFQVGGEHPVYPKGQWIYLLDIQAHMNIGSMFDDYVCQVRTYKENDPICDYIRACPRSGTGSLSTNEYKVIAPKRRCAYLVWVHDTPEDEAKGIQIWEVAHWNSERNISAIAKHPKGGAPVPFSDVEDGKSIAFSVVKTGKYIDSQGKEQDSKDFSGFRFCDRETPIPDDFDEQIFSLDLCIKWKPTWEEQAKAFPMSNSDAPNRPTLPASTQEPSKETQSDDTPIQDEPDPDEKAVEVVEGECPGGGQFGVDMEKLPECNGCDIWDACADEADKILKKKAAKETKDAKAAKKTKVEKKEEKEPPPKKTMIRRRRRT